MLTINNTVEGYLKNVEIKGNTIQNPANLADIKSVGDKVEGQDLYEIPLLSVGKNLFDGKLESGTIGSDNGTNVTNSNEIRSVGYIRNVKNKAVYISTSSNITFGIRYYDKDFKYIGFEGVVSGNKLTFPSNSEYFRFKLITTDLNTKVQIETDLRSQYEPYKEDKLTILSSKQLKSFDGAKDRIVEKNGIWVHEENVTYDAEGKGTKLSTPIDTPLPHGQQVALRTFANKTNISFLTEIEGTIKADVPKSLGATVNVHTKEIDNIYTELDRVKKLEQSTVSTVTTDKDFVSVEQTNQGYFEDVELKGRTCLLDAEGNEVEVGTEGATLTSVGDGTDEIVVSTSNTLDTEDENYKEDKKRLLFYNPTSEKWEKPILREWDSVNKKDGKYYYHVGSTERPYAEGDETKPNCITDMTTTVEKLSTETVYEATNIDLITYSGETNFCVKSGVLSPRTTLKVHSNISNVVSLLQKKVSLLESNMTKYMITQNRLMLTSRYNADNATFKIDYNNTLNDSIENKVDEDLFKLLYQNIIVGKENYDYDKMIEIIDFYAFNGFITWDVWDAIWLAMELQHNPPVEEEIQ